MYYPRSHALCHDNHALPRSLTHRILPLFACCVRFSTNNSHAQLTRLAYPTARAYLLLMICAESFTLQKHFRNTGKQARPHSTSSSLSFLHSVTIRAGDLMWHPCATHAHLSRIPSNITDRVAPAATSSDSRPPHQRHSLLLWTSTSAILHHTFLTYKEKTRESNDEVLLAREEYLFL